eukprot:1509235-Alexandrium_andersonii.AAC.1
MGASAHSRLQATSRRAGAAQTAKAARRREAAPRWRSANSEDCVLGHHRAGTFRASRGGRASARQA